MGFIRHAFTIWLNEKHAEGMIALLNKSVDPLATLQTYRRGINDTVVRALMLHSYQVAKTQGHKEGFKWLEIARQASLMAGSAESLADCLDWHALLLLDQYEKTREPASATSLGPGDTQAILDEALVYAQKALQGYQEAKIEDKIPVVLGRISVIYRAMNKIPAAFENRLLSIIGWANLEDAADALPASVDDLVALYWELEVAHRDFLQNLTSPEYLGEHLKKYSKSRQEFPALEDLPSPEDFEQYLQEQGAIQWADKLNRIEMLLKHTSVLQEIASRLVDAKRRGDLYDLLGYSCRELAQVDSFSPLQEGAFWHWERAVSCYQNARVPAEEFRVLGWMQEYALRLMQVERSIEYGEARINVAPSDANPVALAISHYWLAAAYRVLEREGDAIDALHRAAVLYSQDDKGESFAGECLFQAAMLEKELGMIDKALKDLEEFLSRSGVATLSTKWVAKETLAELYWQYRRDLGKAIQYADEAAQTTIWGEMDFALRAASLRFSGILYMAIGDAEKALNRFQAVLEILESQATEPIVIYTAINLYRIPIINEVFQDPVVLPSRADTFFQASLAAQRLGRIEEAQFYWKQFQSFSNQEPERILPAEYYTEALEAGEDERMLEVLQLLMKGYQLLSTDPVEARIVLERAISLLSSQVEMVSPDAFKTTQWLLASTHHTLGRARLRLDDVDGAVNCFYQALEFLSLSPNSALEVLYRGDLGTVEALRGNFPSAYEQLSMAIQIIEEQRGSLAEENQRMLFFQPRLDIYMIFIGVCVHLQRFTETLETVERIKSRILTDLLAQQERKPIDYSSLERIRALETEREKWLRDFLHETWESSHRKEQDFLNKAAEASEGWQEELHEWLDLRYGVKFQRELDMVKLQLEDRQLFLELESQSEPLKFEDIRKLCRAI